MADAKRAALLPGAGRPHLDREGMKDIAMLEFLMMAQMARNPLQVIARRWYCKSLYRATRGQRRCPECTAS
jgi:hypothetical protein